MTAQSTAAVQRVKEPDLIRRSGEEIFAEFTEMQDLIAKRAFALFENRGCLPGHDVEDWFHAESELLRPVPLDIKELNAEYVVRAEVPGFSRNDIRIGVEPRRLAISGRRETIEHEANGGSIRSEFCADRILRAVDLPSEIDTGKVSTALRDGMLTVDLPKAAMSRNSLE